MDQGAESETVPDVRIESAVTFHAFDSRWRMQSIAFCIRASSLRGGLQVINVHRHAGAAADVEGLVNRFHTFELSLRMCVE
jgi:hypothetical protein